MSGYPNKPYSSSYGPPPPSHASPQSHAPPPYSSPYSPSAPPYTNPSGPYQPQQQPSYSDPSKPPKDPSKPPKDHQQHTQYGSHPYGSSSYGSSGYGGAQSGYGASAPYGNSPFAILVPSVFPPGTDPNVIACFQVADQDGSGLIDDRELQGALSSYGQGFSMRTVHLLMYNFTNTNARKIGPKEFAPLFYGLQNWRSIFERFDRDRSGKIDPSELREALLSLGYAVSPTVLELLVSKFDKTGGKSKAIEYDNFIECCLTVKGLTEKFKAKDTHYSGSATFAYEEFMLTVLPFLIA